MRGNCVVPRPDRIMVTERLDRGFLVWLLSTQMETEVRMFHVLRRDESTLRAIVLRHIRPGTEIWTDEWRAYTNIPRWVLNGQPYGHRTVNHQQNFVNPVTGASTQMVERAWRCARLKIIKNANNVHPNSFVSLYSRVLVAFDHFGPRTQHKNIFTARQHSLLCRALY